MKTKSIIYTFSVLALAGGLMLTGCKKKETTTQPTEDGQASKDNQELQSNSDAVNSDANTAIGNYSSLNGKQINPNMPNVLTSVCGASVDATNLNAGSITLVYDGITVCNNRKRGGSIVLTILNHSSGTKWKDVGAVLQIDYQNFIVTRASDGKNIKFNGTQYLTNKSGGTWLNLFLNTQANLSTEVTSSTAGMDITFDGAKTAKWNINRRFTYTWNSSTSVLTCTGEGIGSYNGLNNLENWGTTRDGDNFTSQVTTPVVWNTTCGSWAPVQGAVDIEVANKGFGLIVTFGVNNTGVAQPIVANSCPYGWKLEWTYNSKTNNKVFGYL